MKAIFNGVMNLVIVALKGKICQVNFLDESINKTKKNGSSVMTQSDNEQDKLENTRVLNLAVIQLEQYFNGSLTKFDLPLSLSGTPFQNKVYNGLLAIEYGKNVSYKDLAKYIGLDKAYRAVGNACNSNSIPIIVPCHRVVSSKPNNIGGFAYNVKIKEFLLEHEQNVISCSQSISFGSNN